MIQLQLQFEFNVSNLSIVSIVIINNYNLINCIWVKSWDCKRYLIHNQEKYNNVFYIRLFYSPFFGGGGRETCRSGEWKGEFVVFCGREGGTLLKVWLKSDIYECLGMFYIDNGCFG